LTAARSRVILPLIMAAMLHLDLPCTRCGAWADIGFAQGKPTMVEVQSR
jgi:hypothetical protein